VPSDSLIQDYGVLGTAALVSAMDSVVPITLMNVQDKLVTLPKGLHLAQLSPVRFTNSVSVVYPIEDDIAMDLPTLAPEILEEPSPQFETLDIDLSHSCLNNDQKRQLHDLILEFRDVFAVDMSELGVARGVEADIRAHILCHRLCGVKWTGRFRQWSRDT
jgi:hypothetical protein